MNILSPSQIYKTLEKMNNDFQAEETERQDRQDPSEGTPWHPGYINSEDRKETRKVTNIPF